MSKRAAGGRNPSEAQVLLSDHLKELGFGAMSFEYQFCHNRKWKADIAATRLVTPTPPAVSYWEYFLFECDGGMFHGGHKRGEALEKDYERQNYAIAKGYKLFRFTNRQILNGLAKKWLAENLGQKGREG